jgi:uncharacterized protein YceH (UPF0502 family)
MATLPRQLSALEARVVGVLVEKERTVPDTYPLSLNALVAGCNQKTSRAPLMEASDADVQAALDELRALSLVVETSGGRVMRYSHNLPRVLGVPAESAALVATLMLRGAQTRRASHQRRAAAPLRGPGLAPRRISPSSRRGRGALCRRAGARAGRAREAAGCTCCAANRPQVERMMTTATAAEPRNDRLAELEARIARLEARVAALDGREPDRAE